MKRNNRIEKEENVYTLYTGYMDTWEQNVQEYFNNQGLNEGELSLLEKGYILSHKKTWIDLSKH